jgi:integrase
MRDIDHHIISSKNRLLSFRQSFRDAETGERVRIRESLQTKSIAQARSMRDILYEKDPKRRSRRNYRSRRDLAFNVASMESSDYKSSHLSDPSDKTQIDTSISREKILERYAKHKSNGGSNRAMIAACTNQIKCFFRFIGREGVYARKAEASEFESALRACKARSWMDEENFLKESDDASQRISYKTVQNILSSIKSFYNFCSDNDYIGTNPFANIHFKTIAPKKVRPRMSPESVNEMRRLIAPVPFDQLEWETIIDLASRLGARRGELLALRREDIILDAPIPYLKVITLKQRQPDGNIPRRNLPIPSRSMNLIKDIYRRRSEGPIFKSLYTETEYKSEKLGSCFGRKVGALIKPIILNADFHSFRKYVGSELADAGVPEGLISTILGHALSGTNSSSSFASITRVYIDRDFSIIRDAIEKVR